MDTNVTTLTNQNSTDISINYHELSEQEKAKIDSIMSSIDVSDSQGVLQYGVQAQSNIAGFSDTILSEVRNKDTGYVGEVLADLMVNMKDLNVGSLSNRKGFFSRLRNTVNKFIARYDKMSVNLDKIIRELDKAKMQLLKDITVLDSMYDKNLEYFKELEFYIMAGDKKIKELNESVIPEMKQKAQESGDPADAQRVNDYLQLVNRFEKKVHDLKLSRMIAIQTSPQLRLIQNGDQVLVEKIQSSILNTIPLWKNQIVIAISLFRQEKALKLQKEVTNTTNELLTKNSEMLKKNTIGVAKESERGIVEIETLQKVNTDLIETIEETLRIQEEGKEKRKNAEQELQQMESQLKEKLIEIRG